MQDIIDKFITINNLDDELKDSLNILINDCFLKIVKETVFNTPKSTDKIIQTRSFFKNNNPTKSNGLLSPKQEIIKLFNENVRGVEILLNNKKHDGQEGHWLETKMGIKHNAKNEPDINGYEMKKSSNKITFGDFSASEYLFSSKRNFINEFNNWTDSILVSRKDFIHYFGNSNPKKNNRYSWSGSCVPTYSNWNNNGQNLLINENNDIVIYYSYSKDTRTKKTEFPDFLKSDDLLIAIWKQEKMKLHIEKKFNNNGFFICKKIDNKYEKICFGKPFDFEYFIKGIKDKKIIFDSGMYQGNNRNYSQFRGTCIWNDLITEEY